MTENNNNLSGSYALNGVDPHEVAEYEEFLASSSSAREEVTELSDTAVLLGLAVPPVAPSAGLKASIMSQLDAHPQLAPVAPVVAAPGPAEGRARARWATPVVALASIAAAVGLIFGGVAVSNELFNPHLSDFTAISQAEDAQRASVDLDNGSATLVWSSSLASSALIVDGLEPLPASKVYELWYIDDAGARPAGTFTMTEGRVISVLQGDMKHGDTVGVTVEPAGGSESPTTDPVIVIASA